eukprot:254164_1
MSTGSPTEFESVFEEVYENQRVIPLGGWKSPFLPLDYRHWTDIDGKKARKPSQMVLVLNGCWEWKGDWVQSDWSYAKDFQSKFHRKKGFFDSVRRRTWRRTRFRRTSVHLPSADLEKYVFLTDIPPEHLAAFLKDTPVASAPSPRPSSVDSVAPNGVRVQSAPRRVSIAKAFNSDEIDVDDIGSDVKGRSNASDRREASDAVWVAEEVFENQRLVLSGWQEPSLPGDPPAWSDATGKHFTPKDLLDVLPTCRDGRAGTWRWLCDWTLDRGGACSARGWRYGGGTYAHAHARALDMFRRRRWFRVRALDTSELADDRENLSCFRTLRRVFLCILWHVHWHSDMFDDTPVASVHGRQIPGKARTLPASLPVPLEAADTESQRAPGVRDVVAFNRRSQMFFQSLRLTDFESGGAVRGDKFNSDSVVLIRDDLFRKLSRLFLDCFRAQKPSVLYDSDRARKTIARVSYLVQLVRAVRARPVPLAFLTLQLVRFLTDIVLTKRMMSDDVNSPVQHGLLMMHEMSESSCTSSIHTDGIIHLDALDLMLDALEDLDPLNCVARESMSGVVEEYPPADPQLISTTKGLCELFEEWLRGYHSISTNSDYSDTFATALTVYAHLGHWHAQWTHCEYDVRASVGELMKRSASELIREERLSFPSNNEDWTDVDWKEFGELVADEISHDFECFMPKIRVPFLKFPGQFALCGFAEAFCVEICTFLKSVPEMEISSRVAVALKSCANIRDLFSTRTWPPDALSDDTVTKVLADLPDPGKDAAGRMEKWNAEQFQKIIGWIRRCVESDDFLPMDEKSRFSFSVIDSFVCTFEFMDSFLRKLQVLSDVLAQNVNECKDVFVFGVRALVKEYVDLVVCDTGSVSALLDTVKIHEQGLSRSDMKRGRFEFDRALNGGLPVSDGERKCLAIPTTLPYLCVRYSNLTHAQEKMSELQSSFYKRFSEIVGNEHTSKEQSDLSIQNISFESANLLRTLAYRLIYVDLGDVFIGHTFRRQSNLLLTGADDALTQLHALLDELDELLVAEDSVRAVVCAVFSVYMSALEWMLVRSRRTFRQRDTGLLRADLRNTYALFTEYIDVDLVLDSSEARAIELIIDHMEKPTTELVEMHRKLRKIKPKSEQKVHSESPDVDTPAEADCSEVDLTSFLSDLEKTETDTIDLCAFLSQELKPPPASTTQPPAPTMDARRLFSLITRRESKIAREYIQSFGVTVEESVFGSKLEPSEDYAYTLAVTVSCAEGLPAKDILTNRSDPFVIVEFGTEKRETSVVRRSLNPVWNQRFNFGLSKNSKDPTNLKLTVFDYDLTSRNDYIGEIELQTKLFYDAHLDPFWETIKNPKNLFLDLGKLELQINIFKN